MPLLDSMNIWSMQVPSFFFGIMCIHIRLCPSSGKWFRYCAVAVPEFEVILMFISPTVKSLCKKSDKLYFQYKSCTSVMPFVDTGL